MRRWKICLVLCLFLLIPRLSHAADRILDPVVPVPDEIQWLLEVARAEIGYTEGAHGYTKYGEWSGDPYAQWCAEFLCWCVHETDETYGTSLLEHQYPLYSSSNTGRSWFIREGRYIVRNGHLENWGYQWLKGDDHFLTTGTYIPQPGDWVFFTWTNNTDTDHVAMVEYCSEDTDTGDVTIHVIEGNTPDQVKRAAYPLTYTRILGYGTVHDLMDVTMRSGNQGAKVTALQEKLLRLSLLTESDVDGRYGGKTAAAVSAFQSAHGLRANGIASLDTQKAIDRAVEEAVSRDPATWTVDADTEDWPDLDRLLESPPVRTEDEITDDF